MANNNSDKPQLPTSAIEKKSDLNTETEHWFEYTVKAQPHHTDYGGIVWHGTYLTWMETARIECLRSIGVDFAELVALGCDLPVVELSLKYRRPVHLGTEVVIRTRLTETAGVRIHWDYELKSVDYQELFVTGRVTLVGVDREQGTVIRKLPANLQKALVKIQQNNNRS